MTEYGKSEQWKRATIVLAWIDEIWAAEPQSTRDSRCEHTLRLALGQLPWEYRWHEVIHSIRLRSKTALAKRGKSA